jgi:hypothetical protein
MRALLVAAGLLCALPVIAGKLYKWEDGEGKVHYTDAPPAQGKVLNAVSIRQCLRQ